MRDRYLIFAFWLVHVSQSLGQTWSGTQISITHPTLGENGDNTSLFRVDPYSDFTSLRLRLGDEESSNFEIGYNYYSGGQWYSNFSLDGYGTGYFRGNLGIGASSGGARLHVQTSSVNQTDNTAVFHAPNIGPNMSHIHWGTTGDWYIRSAGNTGKVIIQDSPGNVGIGTGAPAYKLQVSGGAIALDADQPLRGGGKWLISGNANEVKVGTANPGVNLAFDAGDSDRMLINGTTGNVGIGTTAPDSKLTVKGTVHSQEVKVDLAGAVAPDYVFDKGYPLTSLEELKSYIEENKHLPEIPSAKEMEENGINLKDMNLMLLKKVEELTLHQIESARKIETLEKKLSLLLKDN